MVTKTKKRILSSNKANNKTKKTANTKDQLFSNNHPDTTVHGYGFDTPEHIKAMLDDLHNRDITYQFQVVNTMCSRAKEVFKRTKDSSKRSNLMKGIKLLDAWLNEYKVNKRFEKENYSYLPVDTINKLERLAEYYNISRKARGLEKPTKSDEGFLSVYRRIGGKFAQLRTMPVRASKPTGETWDKHRNNYIVRRLSMLKNAGIDYGLYHTEGNLAGLPTVLHVNMIMWAYSPDKRLLEPAMLNKIVSKLNTIIKQNNKTK